MSGDVSLFRLYSMRAVYLLTFLGVGFNAWSGLINPGKAWDPLHGVAFSFWAAYSAMMGLGVRYPLAMLPLLILQLFYKSAWLIAVALPLSSAGQGSGLTKTFVIAVIVDLIVIPWPYVWARYVRQPAERWR